jgi:hypothetical protein
VVSTGSTTRRTGSTTRDLGLDHPEDRLGRGSGLDRLDHPEDRLGRGSGLDRLDHPEDRLDHPGPGIGQSDVALERSGRGTTGA